MSDKRLRALGVAEEELPAVASPTTIEALEAAEDRFDPLSYQVLYALAAGYTDEEVYALTGVAEEPEGTSPTPAADLTFDRLIETEESRQTIFIPDIEAELRRVFEEGLEGWRVFLHPEQRKIAYRDYNGPAMVRGGAGTGKTVVAMHRAKHIADQIETGPDPSRSAGPADHLHDQPRAGHRSEPPDPVSGASRRAAAPDRGHQPRPLGLPVPQAKELRSARWRIFGEARDRLDQIWREVLDDHELPEGLSEAFVKAEWAQIVQAKGLTDQRAYLKASRAGRGTPLDRRKRAALWDVFADYRARMISEGLAEPDDAYREATEILSAEAPNLPYAAVIVDEAQDMGEQAFRLIRAIVPETPTGTGIPSSSWATRISGSTGAAPACPPAGSTYEAGRRRLRLNYRTTAGDPRLGRLHPRGGERGRPRRGDVTRCAAM